MSYKLVAQTRLSTLAAACVAFSSLAVGANSAQALTVRISPTFGSTENTGSTANLNFGFVQQGADVLLNLGIQNTTNGTVGLGATQSTLVGVGFNLPHIVTSVIAYNPQSSNFTKTFGSLPGSSGDAYLPPLGKFDVGIRSADPTKVPKVSSTFVGGNPQQGLTAGQSGLVSFLLGGNNLTAFGVEAAFQNLFATSAFPSPGAQIAGRFQQVNAGGGSDKVAGQATTTAVPTPALLPGLIGLGLSALRKRKQVTAS